MKSKDIRKAFLDFFSSRGHEAVRSSSLIPKNDPTLLFTNAGMVQFKSVFLGEEKRQYTRAVSCQKCLRAGGKHSDLENVGHTSRHHTFFEMLGNFSFGDYFKKEAILLGWELLTGIFKLPKDRLWISVYEKDDEAEKLWKDLTGISSDRIVRLGAKDNFWQMGDTGPCGPCSEIIIDQGEHVGCGNAECRVGCDCDRFLELWNLVFMQYIRDESGNLTPLPKPSIDTGMGLERISAVLQGKLNNFDTDLFRPLISAITAAANGIVDYGKRAESDISIRVIADHIRAISFLLSEGLTPSNEGRGYVLRRIVRRASRHAKLLGVSEPVLYKLVEPVADFMGDMYPELLDEKDRAAKVLRFEEERFSKTLEQGMKIIDEVIATTKKAGLKSVPGDEIFRLYDTYGFPMDLARDIASDNNLILDEGGFHREMEMQRERARASWVGEEEAVSSIYRELLSETGKTEFAGYDAMQAESVVKAMLKEGKVIREASKGEEVEVFLDKTPFYGESGGQVGDTGEMTSDGFRAFVTDTKKVIEGLYSHIIKIKDGKLKVWDRVTCRVDTRRRKAIMSNHTATHLLQASLQNVIGEHVKQAGSLVAPDRLRFDFTHFFPISRDEIRSIEDTVNQKILENINLEISVMDIKDAVASGATALFGEKYGETVRVVKVPGFSSELCGGTHCKATGDIGPFVIVSEGSVASGIRRIEALTGAFALGYFRKEDEELRKISDMLKTEKPLERVEKLLADMKEMEREAERLKGRAAFESSAALIEKARDICGTKVISCRFDGLEKKDLRILADNLKDKLGSGVIVLASAMNGEAAFLSMVTKDLAKKIKAGEILKKVAEIAGGRGGGKPEMAEGGTKDIAKLDMSLEAVYDIIRKQVKS
ncbi:MAG: alanine--tRNA ligase [Nitrospirae bacterium GWF2_44_13]|nr:MAG: alanine--tRNA ligase [Nitrospirae bacterium GWF2_44_13]OGW35273.1 MAG: alanine--tRNA ligase [Nitrospirae bacterium GWD2_44_7]OGW74352.1 MAG: alanine--tRNA ligase [Nitrospirae bacterium RIFOXYC2_FULL_44_7]HBG93070.1 alanine--tRNA ligase [Nitrospiraceae bacterium]